MKYILDEYLCMHLVGYGSEMSDCREARSHSYFESALASQSSGSKGHWAQRATKGYRKSEIFNKIRFNIIFFSFFFFSQFINSKKKKIIT